MKSEITIFQGADFEEVILLTEPIFTTLVVAYQTVRPGQTDITILPGGVGASPEAGDYLVLGGEHYEVLSAPSSVDGGTLVLAEPLRAIVKVSAGPLKFERARDFSGYTEARSSLRVTAQDELLAEFTCSFAGPGKIVRSMSSAVTALIPAPGRDYTFTTKYVQDLEIVDGTGKVERVLNGFAFVSPEVTK